MTNRIALAHLVSHPIPYFAPLYRELARRPEVDLTVYFYSDATLRDFRDREFGRTVRWDGDLLGGYRWRILPSAARTGIGDTAHRRPHWDIVRDVMRGGFDVLWVHGHQHLATWLAAGAARLRGMRVLVRDEQTLLHRRPFPRSLVRGVALRALYSQSSALYIGEANRRHFQHHGMPASRMFAAPYCVDNGRFAAAARALQPQRAAIRRAFGVEDGRPVVLFAGKLIEKKQPLLLIEAFARVRRERECALLFAGDGPLRADVQRLVTRLGVPDVHVAGFLNEPEMSRAYAAADVFVLPSKLHETWGLVVNEAMNFGLPVIVSDKVGCAADLVRSGENGYVVHHDDASGLAAAIARLVADGGLRARLGERSRAIIQEYSIERCADGIVAACAGATQRGERWSTRRAIAA